MDMYASGWYAYAHAFLLHGDPSHCTLLLVLAPVALLRSGYGSGDPCNAEERSHLRGSTVINVGKWGLPCLTGRLPPSLEIHFHVVSCGKNVKPPLFSVIGCEVPLSGATALLNETHGLHTLLYTAGSQITQ